MKEVVDPYYTKLRDAEREATGQEWMSLLRREFLFQRVSVAIARGNTMILNTMKQGWRSGRRAEEIWVRTGARGRPLSDTPPKLAPESLSPWWPLNQTELLFPNPKQKGKQKKRGVYVVLVMLVLVG